MSGFTPDWYLAPGWQPVAEVGGPVTSIYWIRPSYGPRRPPTPPSCPHRPLDWSCIDCYLSVKGWPHK